MGSVNASKGPGDAARAASVEQAGPAPGDAFDRHAARYATAWGDDPVARRMRAFVHEVGDRVFPPGGHIVDIGCGIGIDIAWLRSSGRVPVGLDASAGMVEQARIGNPGVAIHHLSGEHLTTLHDASGPGEATANSMIFDGALLDFGVVNCSALETTAAALGASVRRGAAVVVVPMPRVAPAWVAARLVDGDVAGALARLRRQVDVPVEDGVVSTRYWSQAEIARAFAPWFVVEERHGLGFLLPPPGSGWSTRALDLAEAVERPLRQLPGFRAVGDHVVLVLRRTDAPAAGLLRGGPVARRLLTRHARRTGEVRRLPVLVLELTRGCQSRCVGCDHRGPAGGETLDAAAAGRLAAEARGLGCREVVLTGGEPLLRPDIAEVLAAVRLAGVPVRLLTNGLLLGRHAALVARWCDSVVVSLDGHDAASYRAARGVDGFEMLGRGVAAVREQASGMPITARVTVTALNAGKLADIAHAARTMGLDGVSFLAADTAHGEAFGRSGDGPALSLPDADALRSELQSLRERLPPGFVLDSDSALDRIWQKYAADAGVRSHRPPRCDAPWTSAVVGPDLSLSPCFFLGGEGVSASGGLRAGLRDLGPRLAGIDVQTDPVCARCVCWARLT